MLRRAKKKEKLEKVTIDLGYTRKGDDFDRCVKSFPDPVKAMRLQAELLRGDAYVLDMVSAAIEGLKVRAYGDQDTIELTVPENVAGKMINNGWVASFDPDED